MPACEEKKWTQPSAIESRIYDMISNMIIRSFFHSNPINIHFNYLQASTIDGRRKGACLFCQEYFMDLYLLAELKTISLKVSNSHSSINTPAFLFHSKIFDKSEQGLLMRLFTKLFPPPWSRSGSFDVTAFVSLFSMIWTNSSSSYKNAWGYQTSELIINLVLFQNLTRVARKMWYARCDDKKQFERIVDRELN